MTTMVPMTYLLEISCDADGTEILVKRDGEMLSGWYIPFPPSSGSLDVALEGAWASLWRLVREAKTP